jgi:putative tricarboxylic transport membrane protein
LDVSAEAHLLVFFVVVLPGGGAIVSSFLSYTSKKRLPGPPEEFGRGVIERVAVRKKRDYR